MSTRASDDEEDSDEAKPLALLPARFDGTAWVRGRSSAGVLLSRLPMRRLELHPFPTIMGRRLLLAELQVNDGSLAIGVVHLESTKEMAGTRAEQLERTVKALAASPQGVAVR